MVDPRVPETRRVPARRGRAEHAEQLVGDAVRVDGADGPAQLAEGEAVRRPVEPGREARARVDELQVPCGVAAALDEVRLVRGRGLGIGLG